MIQFLSKAFGIREGEGARALLMFTYIFLVISCLLIVKPVRNALFLENFSAADLPFAFILVAVAATFVSTIYNRMADRVRLNMLIGSSLGIIISNLLIFRAMLYFQYQPGWFIYGFYVWVAIFAAVSTSQFWILANYIFDVREAKRLFGFVGAGAISGGIFGGYLTNFAAPLIGTDNLLLVCVVFLGICVAILQKVWPMRQQDSQTEKKRQQRQMDRQKQVLHPLALLKNSRHLAYLAGIVAVGVVVANIVDFQYTALVEANIADKDARTAFFGFWLSTLSIVSLFFQLFLTGPILRSVGVGPSLFFLPLGILVGAVAILVNPALWTGVLIKVSEGSFKQSIHKAGLELLILPIPSQIKTQAKSLIDVLVDSLATGMGGLLLIFFTRSLGLDAGQISLIVIPLIVLWIVLVFRIRPEYVEAFRTAIEKRTIDLAEQSVNMRDASIYQSLLTILDGNNDRQIIYVLKLLENVNEKTFLPYLRKLLANPNEEIRCQALKMLTGFPDEDFSGEIRPLIVDPSSEIRTDAAYYLLSKAGSNSRYRVREELLAHQDYRTSGATLVALARLGDSHWEGQGELAFENLIKNYLGNIAEEKDDPAKKTYLKRQVARAIGIARKPRLYPVLNQLLADSNEGVRRAAVVGAGETENPEFAAALIPLLQEPRLRKPVREALANYGKPVIEQLNGYLQNGDGDIRFRGRLVRVLGQIGNQNAVDALARHVEARDPFLKDQIIRSLNRLHRNYPLLKMPVRELIPLIQSEIQQYYCLMVHADIHRALFAEEEGPREVAHARRLLIRALTEKREKGMERIFRLVGLCYPQEDIHNAYLGLTSTRSDLRANALEFLDNVLSPTLKRGLMPLLEVPGEAEMLVLAKGQVGGEIETEIESLRRLLKSDDPWLGSCTLFLVGGLKMRDFEAEIRNLTASTSPVLSETAALAFRQLNGDPRV